MATNRHRQDYHISFQQVLFILSCCCNSILRWTSTVPLWWPTSYKKPQLHFHFNTLSRQLLSKQWILKVTSLNNLSCSMHARGSLQKAWKVPVGSLLCRLFYHILSIDAISENQFYWKVETNGRISQNIIFMHFQNYVHSFSAVS